MATLAELRAKAKRLGITASVIRGASTVKELQSVITDFSDDGKAPAKKKKTATAAAPKRRGPGRPPGSKNKPKAEEAPKRRGRPPGSGTKKSASGTKAPAKNTAKRPSSTRRPAAADKDAGRFLLESIDYRETDGWNPRPGSAPDRIVKALRKFRGNREKVYDFLVGDLWDFVSKVKQDGTKRSLADARKMLQYRIARTDWEFAVRTGQHQKSENRVEYGTGGNGNPKPKAKAPARKTAAKPAAKATRGRPKAATKAQEAPKRRGRPPGSKNKPKVAAKPAARRTAAKPKRTAARRGR